MSQRIQHFNRRVPAPFRYLIAGLAGLLLWMYILPGVLLGAELLRDRYTGQRVQCPASRLALMRTAELEFEWALLKNQLTYKKVESDPKLPLDLVSGPSRPFWLERSGDLRDSKELLAYLEAELATISAADSWFDVRPGDTVIDCGAHVGTFTLHALERGAAKVVAVEPNPNNVECLRRNFKNEIATGRVVVVPEGVWDKKSTMDLFIGAQNSGAHSMIYNQGLGSIKVPVDTIDHLRARLHLAKVDFIKTDIEGAERNALRGARETLRLYRPRLRMDANHREDDIQMLPAVARQGNPEYKVHCGYCETAYNEFRPHVLLLD